MHPSPSGKKFRALAQTGNRKSAFTIVELLIAAAVLALLVVLVAQMVGSIASGTAASGKRISADDEARMVFDRMAGDFSGMIMRPDVNPLFIPNAGNDEIYFYSRAPAFFTNKINSQIALIGYRVTTNGLERLGQGQGWDDLLFTNGPVATNASSTNFSAIAPSVFRMECALLMKQGSTNNDGTVNGTKAFFQTNNPGQAMKDVSGVVVALGILDQASRKITPAGTVSGWSNDVTDFPDATINGIQISGSSGWLTKARSIPGIPRAASSQIRIYQRYFPLAQ
ncbi:MAG: hypothetical protein K8R38_10100 [Verrucomicrobia bacterium]|nr:hypothetical protein [Verrucomicrobiota bacterium]